MTVKSAVVIGAGTMGRSIAQWLAQMGVETSLVDSFPEILPKAESAIKAPLGKSSKPKISLLRNKLRTLNLI